MIFYHCTDSASTILREGFRDAEGTYGLEEVTLRGVFISDQPLSIQEGAKGDQILEIILPSNCDLSDYELIEEGKPYREWHVPANVLNENGQVRLVEE
jgi:hypothetical protein